MAESLLVRKGGGGGGYPVEGIEKTLTVGANQIIKKGDFIETSVTNYTAGTEQILTTEAGRGFTEGDKKRIIHINKNKKIILFTNDSFNLIEFYLINKDKNGVTTSLIHTVTGISINGGATSLAGIHLANGVFVVSWSNNQTCFYRTFRLENNNTITVGANYIISATISFGAYTTLGRINSNLFLLAYNISNNLEIRAFTINLNNLTTTQQFSTQPGNSAEVCQSLIEGISGDTSLPAASGRDKQWNGAMAAAFASNGSNSGFLIFNVSYNPVTNAVTSITNNASSNHFSSGNASHRHRFRGGSEGFFEFSVVVPNNAAQSGWNLYNAVFPNSGQGTVKSIVQFSNTAHVGYVYLNTSNLLVLNRTTSQNGIGGRILDFNMFLRNVSSTDSFNPPSTFTYTPPSGSVDEINLINFNDNTVMLIYFNGAIGRFRYVLLTPTELVYKSQDKEFNKRATYRGIALQDGTAGQSIKVLTF